MMKSITYHGPGHNKLDDSALVACVPCVCLACTGRVGERIGALVQRAYSVFNGPIKILGCADYPETEHVAFTFLTSKSNSNDE
jgi:hypothetical protein